MIGSASMIPLPPGTEDAGETGKVATGAGRRSEAGRVSLAWRAGLRSIGCCASSDSCDCSRVSSASELLIAVAYESPKGSPSWDNLAVVVAGVSISTKVESGRPCW